MSIRFGSVRNLAVHEIFSDDHDVRKDIDLIDGKTFIDDIQKVDIQKVFFFSSQSKKSKGNTVTKNTPFFFFSILNKKTTIIHQKK